MNIDLKTIKPLKKLGNGLHATVYLVTYNNQNYALKVLKIFNNKINKNSQIWNELDLYKYIDKLKPIDQSFFTKLYYYKIYYDCNKHKYTKELYVNNNKSNICIKYLQDYKGDTTLSSYIENNLLSNIELYSLILQLCHIQLILFKNGYSHGDLHLDNIMINKTNKKYFKLLNKKIYFNGLQISIIDYGSVFHKKFNNIKKNSSVLFFLTKPVQYMYAEIYKIIIKLLKLPVYIDGITVIKLIKKIIKYHPVFFNEYKNNNENLFLQYESIFSTIQNSKKNEIFKNILLNNQVINEQNKQEFIFFVYKLIDQFCILYPKLFNKYVNLNLDYICPIPINDAYSLLKINSIENLINFCILKIELINKL